MIELLGTGLGYQAKVMAELGAEVFSIKVVEGFADAAQSRLPALGYDAKLRVGDGTRGWAGRSPFDAILVTAAASETPPELLDQIKPGGRLVIPPGKDQFRWLPKVPSASHFFLAACPATNPCVCSTV